jgi:hypothetical protein
MFPDGSKRTIPPRVEDHSGVGYYPDLVRVKTEPQDTGTDKGGFEIYSQAIGEVFNLPAIEELDENEVVFVSGFVVSALEAQGAFHYSGRVVAPGKTKRGEHGFPECILSWTTVRAK